MAARRPSLPPSSGVLLVDKPSGMTSHAVVGQVRRVFGQREVGHTGTLDPLATGLLVLALGRATRIARFIEATEKRYVGTVTLGRATTTFDAEGTTTAEAAVGAIADDVLERALAGLVGRIPQAVPQFSAVKVDGTRLYARARRGEEFEAPIREVVIHELVLREVRLPELVIEARVSKGTYIRSLAVQIGAALGLPAHLSALRRTRVGAHSIDSARALDALTGSPDELIPAGEAVSHLPSVTLDGALARDVAHGRALSAQALRDLPGEDFGPGAEVRLLGPDGGLLAIGLANAGRGELPALDPSTRMFRYACVLQAAVAETAPSS